MGTELVEGDETLKQMHATMSNVSQFSEQSSKKDTNTYTEANTEMSKQSSSAQQQNETSEIWYPPETSSIT